MLAPQALLEIWERANHQAAAGRAAALLEAVRGKVAAETLPVGERDRLLLGLFELNFGTTLHGTGACDACGTELELVLEVRRLLAEPAAQRPPVVTIGGADRGASASPAWAMSWRPPGRPDRRATWRRLCAGRSDDGSLSDEDVARIGDALLAADPLLDPEIGGTCPECGAQQAFGLDVATFVWERLAARARRLMGEVHLLARAYGWSEGEILALSPARRSAYLAMVTA